MWDWLLGCPYIQDLFFNFAQSDDGDAALVPSEAVLQEFIDGSSLRSYDVALITEFVDRASFDAYQTHPVHMPVKKHMHEVRSASVACDYEF